MHENTFQPKTNKNRNYVITNNVIERNQDFIHKKNEKMQKRINDEKEALTFTPTLQTAKSQKRFKEVTGLKGKQESVCEENGLSLLV